MYSVRWEFHENWPQISDWRPRTFRKSRMVGFPLLSLHCIVLYGKLAQFNVHEVPHGKWWVTELC